MIFLQRMSLEINLKRSERTPWGFRLIGGTDFEIPLTVVKATIDEFDSTLLHVKLECWSMNGGDCFYSSITVQKDSIAEVNGLRNSDILLSINGRPAHSMSHDEAHDAIVRAGHNLQLVICRGPFDQGTGFETTTSTLDTDHTFQPSEVENRPVSPFVPQTKPYRPFSTEPVSNVPPVEDPIILNPNYNDKFPKYDFKEKFKTIFKLPISPQYKGDPDEVVNNEFDIQNSISSINVNDNVSINGLKVEMTKEEVEFDLKMKEELNLFEIEQTASAVINENLEAALNVTEEIKHEIDIELTNFAASETVQDVKFTEESIETINSTSTRTDLKETVEISNSLECSKNQVTTKNEVSEIHKQEAITETESQQEIQDVILNISQNDIKTETVGFNKEYITETQYLENIETNEKTKQTNLKNKTEDISTIVENNKQITAGNTINDNTLSIDYKDKNKEHVSSKVTHWDQDEEHSHTTTTKNTKTEQKIAQDIKANEHRSKEEKSSSNIKTSQKQTTKENLAEQRAYVLGLQTIPNIRGRVQTGYHYDMLLRTFFIHLTDVMVALSRFILIEKPPLSISSSTENLTQVNDSTNVVKTEEVVVNNSKSVKEQTNNTEIIEQARNKAANKESMRQAIKKHAKDVKKAEEAIIDQAIISTEANDNIVMEVAKSINQESIENKNDTYKQSTQDYKETVEVRERKSGSKMAQLTEKKTEQLIQNMDAVVSEFQTKTESLEISETDETKAINNARRSRSKSRIEEEVSKESDPLEWLSKNIETTESVSSENIHQRTDVLKSITKNTVQRQTEKLVETSETSPNAKTYIAIVQAHVYTNKDLIGVELSEINAKERNAYEVKSSLENTNSEDISVKKEIVCQQKQEEFNETHNEIKENIQLVENQKSIIVGKTEVLSQTEKSLQQATSEIKIENIDILAGKIHQESVHKEELNVNNKINSKTVEAIVDKTINEAVQVNTSFDTNEIKEHNTESIDLAKTIIKDFIQNEQLTKNVQIINQNILDVSVNEEKQDQKEENALQKEMSLINQLQSVNEETLTDSNKSVVLQDLRVEEKSDVYTIEEHLPKNEKLEHLEVIESCEGEILEEIVKEQEITLEEAMKKSNIAIITCEPIILESRTQEKTFEREFKEKTVTLESKSSNHEKTVKFETEVKQHNLEEVEEMAAIFERATQSKLSLKLNTTKEFGDLSKTPTPSTIPPTPLTDEYVFRLDLPLIESKNPIKELTPPSESLEHEDPNIVKKRLIPHIETEIQQLVYDHPLPSPAINLAHAFPPHAEGTLKEEILDIERKSSLLASVIDETIRSIEEYKEQAGIEFETNKSTTLNDNITNSNVEEFDVTTNNMKAKTIMNIINNDLKKLNTIQTSTITDELLNEFNIDNIEKISCFNNQTQNIETNQMNKKLINDITQSNVNECIISENNATQYTQLENKSIEQDWTKVSQQVSTNTENNTTQSEINECIKSEKNATELTHLEKTSIEQDWAKVAQQVTTNTENLARLTEIKVAQENNDIVGDIPVIPGTNEGIMNTMEGSTVMNEQVANEIGKPGMSDDKIAELISGEAEMLREAHVMGLKRVIASHMTRPSDSSVDFKKIKPIIENLKDSQVLKALNEEVMKTHEEKKKEERKWTTFLQKPQRPVPQNKLGYLFRYTQPEEENAEESYKVKIIKQPKPKVAPDYKAEDFETGPLPWEERAANEPPPPPIPREEPILVPEGVPEYLEAVDPLPESEVPDLEDTGIPLPKEKVSTPLPLEEVQPVPEEPKEVVLEVEEKVEGIEECKKEEKGDSENKMADELLGSIQNMVDPNATLEQQLNQMRSQLAALAQLPGVIQQTLDLVTKQLTCLNTQEICQTVSTQETKVESTEIIEAQERSLSTLETVENQDTTVQITDVTSEMETHEAEVEIVSEAIQKLKADEAMMLEEQRKVEKEKKELERLDQESRKIKAHSTPRVGKPKPAFGPLTPQERPLVLPGGRKWRTPKDAFNEEFIAETLSAQAELIQGKAKG